MSLRNILICGFCVGLVVLTSFPSQAMFSFLDRGKNTSASAAPPPQDEEHQRIERIEKQTQDADAAVLAEREREASVGSQAQIRAKKEELHASPEFFHAKMKELRKSITETQQEHSGNRITLLMGRSGSGKSTVYNLIQNIPLVAQWHVPFPERPTYRKLVIERQRPLLPNDEKNGKIGHNPSSETVGVSKNGEFFDLAGFGGNLGLTQEIIDHAILREILRLNNKHKFRIALVVERAKIGGRVDTFLEDIEAIGKILSSRTENLRNSLTLIVTKGNPNDTLRPANIDFIRGEIFEILNDSNLPRPPFQEAVLKLLSEDGKISFFHTPSSPSNITMPTGLIGDHQGVSLTSNVNNYSALSARTRNHIIKEAERITASIQDFFTVFFRNLLNPSSPKSADALVRSSLESVSALREFFGNVANILRSITSAPNALERETGLIKRILLKFSPDDVGIFSRLIEQRKNLIWIDPTLNINVELNYQGALTNTANYLQSFSEFSSLPVDRFLTIKGRILGTSDINAASRSHSFNRIIAYGRNKLHIDADVTAPETSLSLVSPFGILRENHIINLSGKHKISSFPSQAAASSSIHGTNGKPGESGGNGGHYYGKFTTFDRSERLTINTSGGNGGNGQNGGDGTYGKGGVHGSRENLVNAAKENQSNGANGGKLAGRRWIDVLAPAKGYYIQYSDGKLGTEGGNAGKGGQGGWGGSAGKIEGMDGLRINKIKNAGTPGTNGNHGKVGKGGGHGKIWEGTYLVRQSTAGESVGHAFAASAVGSAVGTIGGTAVPGVGNIVGGVIGAVIGGVSGLVESFSAKMIDEQYYESRWEGTLKVQCENPGYAADGMPPTELNLPIPPAESTPLDINAVNREWAELMRTLK